MLSISDMVLLLARRQAVVDRVISIKTREDLPALIPARVEEVIARAETQAIEAGLSPELARLIWTGMVDWFVRHEALALKENNTTPKTDGIRTA